MRVRPLMPVKFDMAPRRHPREVQTATAKNGRLGEQRRNAWRVADAATRYWRTLIDFDDACGFAQRHGIRESFAHSPGDRGCNVRQWREALVKQLLTPAPDAGSIEWKRRTFASGQHRHISMKPERIERVIAADVEWLAAHPTRTKRGTS